MANTGRRAGQATLALTNTTVYTVPALTTFITSTIRVTNLDAATRKFTLFVGPAQTDKEKVANNMPLEDGESAEVGRGLILEAGDTVVGLCDDADKIAVTVCGIEAA